MGVLGWIVLIVLGWYPAGLLIVGFANVFGKPPSSVDWEKDRNSLYGIAWCGPLFIIVLAFVAVYHVARFIASKVTTPLAAVTDWIVAGFRKPPARTTADIQSVSHPELSWPQDLR